MRLTKLQTDPVAGRARWVIEGRIAGDSVFLLTGEFERLSRRQRMGLCVDLSGVVYADQNGADVLLAMGKQGATLTGASPFIREVLRIGAHRRASGIEQRGPHDLETG